MRKNHLTNSFNQRWAQIKNPNFALYLVSLFLGSLGGGLSYIVLAWSVSGFHQGIVPVLILILCFWLPSVLLSPFVGVVVDFVSQRSRILSLVLGIRALLYLGFFAFSWWAGPLSHFNVWCYGISIISGICVAFYSPTISRYTREIVPAEGLMYANTSIDMAYEFGNVIGMGVAGILIALFGVDTAFGIIGVLFAIAGLAFLGVKPGKFREETEPSQGFLTNFLVSLSYLRGNRKLLMIALVQSVILMIIMVTPVLIAPFAREVLHASVVQFGWIEMAVSAGIILGGFILPIFVERFGFKNILMGQLGALVLTFLWFSVNREISIAAFLYFLMGLSFSCWPLLMTEIQKNTLQKYQGRIQSTMNSLSAVGTLLVYLFLDGMGHWIDLSKMYWFEASFVVICMVLLFFYERKS